VASLLIYCFGLLIYFLGLLIQLCPPLI